MTSAPDPRGAVTDGSGADPRVAVVEADPSDQRFPAFPPDVLDELSEFGHQRDVQAGEVLYRAGEDQSAFYVVVDGGVEVLRDDDSQQLVVAYRPGQFIGELGLLTGQRTFLTARATVGGTVLELPLPGFRRVMATKPTISDAIFAALVGRRQAMRSTSAAEAVQIIGSRYSREALALRTFADRNRLAYSWVDLEDADDVGLLLESKGLRIGDSPVVITPTACSGIRRPDSSPSSSA